MVGLGRGFDMGWHVVVCIWILSSSDIFFWLRVGSGGIVSVYRI